jgi:hypothetical protein
VNSRRPTADTRTFIRVHDGIADHPKVEPLSDKAFRLLIETWAWCSRHHTDGRVPLASWNKRSSTKARAELLSSGLATMVGEFIEMHDYLAHQRSAEEIAEVIAAKQEGGLLGNHKRWHEAQGKVDPGCKYCSPKRSVSDRSTDRTRTSVGDRTVSPEAEADTTTTPTPSGADADAPEGETLALVHSIHDDKAGLETDFTEWWKAYPNSAGRTEAYRAYVKARRGVKIRGTDPKRTPASRETLLEGAHRYAAEMRRLGRAKDKIAHGSTWLNGDRWTDGTDAAVRDVAAVRGPVFEGA